jgi:uncharacterized protein with GYD domain
MPKFAAFFSYTSESWAGMVGNPGDRAAAVRQLAESLGGSLESFYWMFGPHDGFAVFEFPDSVSAAAVSVAVASSGAVKSLETHQLITPEDAAAVLEAAARAVGRYSPPGQ